MKRTYLLALAFFVLAPQVFAADQAGQVKLIRGDVLVLDSMAKVVGDSAGKRGRKLEVGAPFYVGETIQTRADGRVKLEFVEGKNEVVLGTNASLLIEKAGDGKGNPGTSLSLARGEVRSNVNRKYSGQGEDVFQVKTPNAVAGVRGTVFMARFNPQTFKSEVATERGLVAVQSLGTGGAGAGREVVVRPGMFTATAGSAPPASPAPIASNPDLEGAMKSLGSSSAGGDGAVESDAGAGKETSKSSGDKKESSTSDSDKKADSNQSSGESTAKSDSKSETKSDTAKSDNKSDNNGAAPGAATSSGAASDSSGGASSSKTASNNPPPAADGPPLGREPVVATNNSSGSASRGPASAGGPGLVGGAAGTNGGGPAGPTPVGLADPNGPSGGGPAPMPTMTRADTVNQALARTLSQVNQINQQVNQQVNQATQLRGTAIIKIQ